MRNRTWMILEIVLFVLVCFAFEMTWHRIHKLEQVCHGQCKYGDAECGARCARAGHCEFMDRE
jgi:hypothetical protein